MITYKIDLYLELAKKGLNILKNGSGILEYKDFKNNRFQIDLDCIKSQYRHHKNIDPLTDNAKIIYILMMIMFTYENKIDFQNCELTDLLLDIKKEI